MADLTGMYDTAASPSQSFNPLPAGEYHASIIEADIEPVSRSSDKGNCLKLTWQIGGGEFANQLVWQRLNMWFSGSEKTPGKVAEIANRQFAQIRESLGVGVVSNTDELLHRPAVIRVAVKTDPSGQYGAQNEVKAVLPAGNAPVGVARQSAGNAPAGNASARQPVAGAGNGGRPALPWKRPAA